MTRQFGTDISTVLEVLEELVDLISETDPYPTSDEHPLYAARAVLKDFGYYGTEEDE